MILCPQCIAEEILCDIPPKYMAKQHMVEWDLEFQDSEQGLVRMFCPHCDFDIYVERKG